MIANIFLCHKLITRSDNSASFDAVGIGRNLGLSKIPGVGTLSALLFLEVDRVELESDQTIEVFFLDPDGRPIAKHRVIVAMPAEPGEPSRTTQLPMEFRGIRFTQCGPHRLVVRAGGAELTSLHIDVALISDYEY